MQGQPHHIEIVLEKNALKSVIQQVASEYCIPMTVGKGFASGPPRHDISQRYRQSGKKNLVLLFLTDFDPDGEVIASSFARSMRDDFYIAERNITGIKVALNADDVRENDFPSDMEAKKSSPNYQEFIKKYGTKVVELDACPVDFLQSKTKEAILSVIDVDEFNAQIEMEKQDAANVEAHRRVVFDAMNGRAAA
jgi:5S rRNA maturation endonuclease (ribonuclease M5)